MSEAELEAWLAGWSPPLDSGLVVQNVLTPAAWLESRLVPHSFEVHMTAPRGYESYVRMFFPFIESRTKVDDTWAGDEYVTWRELAERNGRQLHPLAEREKIDIGSDGRAKLGSIEHSLALEQFEALLPILVRHTASTSGWFLLWEGFGELDRAFLDRFEKVIHPMRSYYLLKGPLSAFAEFSNDPGFWWPDDRAWCYSGDVDFQWSYLAGSAACINEVLAAAVLDAVQTQPDNPARFGMDIVNPAPDGP